MDDGLRHESGFKTHQRDTLRLLAQSQASLAVTESCILEWRRTMVETRELLVDASINDGAAAQAKGKWSDDGAANRPLS